MAVKTVTLYTRQMIKLYVSLSVTVALSITALMWRCISETLRRSLWRATIGLRKRRQSACPKPEDVHAPIWCSISPDNCLKPIEGTVVYILEVPEDKVMYFDDVKWDYVLNRIIFRMMKR